ncbi:MAG TPA: metal-dependent hydrolase [Candidatus Limnocylindrales bacterium]|nr:metal-dependent hydrolase [Candidatus Limnocylindrales bacterium]
MPGYKGHIAGGAVLNVGYIAALTTVPLAAFTPYVGVTGDATLLVGLFVCAMLFALFPDVDTNSKGQDIFIGLALIVDVLLILNGFYVLAAYLGLLAMTPVIGKHRGWTHSKPAMLLVPLPIVLIPYLFNQSVTATMWLFYGAAVTGYFSHLLLDGCITKYIHVKGGR